MQIVRVTFMMTAMIVALGSLALSLERETPSLCIAPVAKIPIPAASPGLFCDSKNFSLKIDEKIMAWPMKGSVKIDTLNADVRHRVVVYCSGKPQQSFGFRFSDYKSLDLCLFLNDLYKTVQLQEVKRSPWCKCN